MLNTRNSGRFIWSEWHRVRQEARETASSTSEFSEIEIERYDLDDARITGEENPSVYIDEPYDGEPVDLRPHKPTRFLEPGLFEETKY